MNDFDNAGGSSDLAMRLVDEFFRRAFWYILPVVLFAGIGVLLAGRAAEQYVSTGTLSVSVNPLVGQPEVSGATINNWETPAIGTARLITEQLRTDAFATDVAERAGLGQALDAGWITPETIRGQIWTGAPGQNFMTINASWGDGDTAYLLVDATIEAYLEFLSMQVAEDSNEAIAFWTEQRDDALASANEAERQLAAFLEALPELEDGADYPVADQFEITRLNDAYDAALEDVKSAQDQIDASRLNAIRAQSEAGRLIRLVDPPEVPTTSTSSPLDQILTIGLMTIVGILVGLTALVITTVLDRTVRSRAQLAAVVGTNATAAVPRIKSLNPKRRAKRAEKKAAA